MNRSRLRVLAALALAASVVSWAGGPAGASPKEARARAAPAALSDRVEFVDTVSRTQAAASAAARARSTELQAQEGRLAAALEQRASALRDLSARRNALQAAFDSQQDLLAADRAGVRHERS